MDIFTYRHASAKDESQEVIDSVSSCDARERPSESNALGRLKQMFPGKMWLTVPQVAVCLNLSAGHLYNQHSAGCLPFKVKKDNSGRLRASMLDLAEYMERQQLLARCGKSLKLGPRLRWLAPNEQPSAVINHTAGN